MFEIEGSFSCSECKTIALIDKNKSIMYCRKCNTKHKMKLRHEIISKLPFLSLQNIECDETEFENYKL